MYMRGRPHQMRRLVLLRLLPVHDRMWRGCGWRALTEPLPWMGDGLVSLAGSMFGRSIDDAFDSGTTGRVGMFGTPLQRQCFRLRRHGGSRARIQGHVMTRSTVGPLAA